MPLRHAGRRHLRAAAVERQPGSAGWNGQPGSGASGSAARRAAPAPVERRPAPASAPPAAAPACRGAAASRTPPRPGRISTTRPRYITATRCARCRTTRRSCDTNRIASPSRSCMSSSRFRICACTDTSSADTISSATSTSGSTASARAMAMRWRWPPENACGSRSAGRRGQPHQRQQLGDPARHRAVGTMRCTAQRLAQGLAHGHARVERAVRVLEHHLHAPVVARRRPARQRAARPRRRNRPARRRASTSRTSARASVDLPQPDSPTTASVSPRCTAS